MKILNRSAIVLRYREPFLLWAASIDEKAPAHAAGLREDIAVYLVPQDPDEEQESAPLEDFFVEIFDHELEDWCPDPSRWPSRRDLTTFKAWFEVTADSIVLDLAPGRIQSDDY